VPLRLRRDRGVLAAGPAAVQAHLGQNNQQFLHVRRPVKETGVLGRAGKHPTRTI